MADTTFRTASEPTVEAPAPTTPVIQAGDSVETKAPELLATYQYDQGRPYTADYFDLAGVWDKTENLSGELKSIEAYLKDQVAKGNLDNSTKTAEKYLKELEKKAGIGTFETTNKRISTLLAYIEFRKTVDG